MGIQRREALATVCSLAADASPFLDTNQPAEEEKSSSAKATTEASAAAEGSLTCSTACHN